MTRLSLSDISQSELAVRLRTGCLRLRLNPFVVSIRSGFGVVAEGLSRLYADYELLSHDPCFIDFHVAVLPYRHLYKSLCVFEMDGFRPFTPLAAQEAYAFLEWGMNWCVTSHCHTFITIHSAVLERSGRVLIMPAPPGSGKSTLCAALMLHSWRLFSDEMALIDPATGMVTPSPRPVSLKNQSIDIIRQRAPSATFGPVARDTLKGTVAHMRVTPDSLFRAEQSARPAWLVFPKYEAGSTLRPVIRPKASSLMQLTENSFNPHVHGRNGFNALADLVDQSDCYDLTYSNLDEAITWFDQLLIPS